MPEKLLRRPVAFFFFFVAFTVLEGRSIVKKEDEQRSFESVARVRLGKKFSTQLNRSATYVLCQQQRENDHSQRRFRYVVIRLSDNRIVLEGTVRMGYVQWHDDLSVETLTSSNARDDVGQKKIISVLSNQQ